jgi:peptide-methionine (S)-S-oxide reductase
VKRYLWAVALVASGVIAFAEDKVMSTNGLERAVFGGGCYWCTEAVFQMLPGVKSVASGFAGGKQDNPSYEEVCTGKTGHAEVIQIEFDPKVISYEKLVHSFWDAHDPTTLNSQGPDHGTQYRSIILYTNDEQKKVAEQSKAEAQKQLSRPIVTEIVPLTKFWKADEHHQNFYRSNPDYGYCRMIIRPKVEKFEKKLKAEKEAPAAAQH